jgi:hypothetical protein
MRFLNPWRKKDTRGNKMPPELVEAIKDLGCIFRAHQIDESGERISRPLTMIFLGGPLHLDDTDAIARRLRHHFPELTARQISRAQSMIHNRVKRIHRDMMDREKVARLNRPDDGSWIEEARRRMDIW